MAPAVSYSKKRILISIPIIVAGALLTPDEAPWWAQLLIGMLTGFACGFWAADRHRKGAKK